MYQVALQDADTAILYEWVPGSRPGFVRSPTCRTSPRTFASEVRALPWTSTATARNHSASARHHRDTLYSAYGNRQVSTINSAANEYYVILEVDPEAQTDPAALSQLYLRSNSGKLVPLSAGYEVEFRSSSAEREPLRPITGCEH